MTSVISSEATTATIDIFLAQRSVNTSSIVIGEDTASPRRVAGRNFHCCAALNASRPRPNTWSNAAPISTRRTAVQCRSRRSSSVRSALQKVNLPGDRQIPPRDLMRSPCRRTGLAVAPNPSNAWSRSWITYFGASSHGNASRNCWAVHAAVGRAVTAMSRMRRRSWARTTSTNTNRHVYGWSLSGARSPRWSACPRALYIGPQLILPSLHPGHEVAVGTWTMHRRTTLNFTVLPESVWTRSSRMRCLRRSSSATEDRGVRRALSPRMESSGQRPSTSRSSGTAASSVTTCHEVKHRRIGRTTDMAQSPSFSDLLNENPASYDFAGHQRRLTERRWRGVDR